MGSRTADLVVGAEPGPQGSIHPAPAGARKLREDAEFRRYWCARTLSTAGSTISLVALPVLVYKMTGSTLITAFISASEAAPYMLLGLVAGALSDRWDRQRVMVRADLINAVLIVTVPLAYWLGFLTVPQVFAVAFLGQSVSVFFDGANFGAVPSLVGRERVGQANAALWGSSTTAQTLIPSVVGVCLAVISPASLLVVTALTFAISAFLVRSLSRPLHDRGREPGPLGRAALAREIAEGLRFLRDYADVRTLTIISGLVCMTSGGFISLMVIWCDQVLGVGTAGWRFGLVYSAWGVGGLAAAISVSRLLRRASAARISLRALPFCAVLGITTSFVRWWPLAVIGLFTWGLAYGLVVINIVSHRQQVTPEPLLGRVNTSSRMIAWGIGYTGGAMASGGLSQLIGLHGAMTTITLVSVIAVVMGWRSPLRATGQARQSAASGPSEQTKRPRPARARVRADSWLPR